MGVIVLCLLLACVPCAAAPPDADELPPHIIALAGHELPVLLGASIGCLRAMALADDGTPHAVPIQIDERIDTGEGLEWVFEGGEGPRRDSDPFFDRDDLLLLDVRDAGRCGPTAAGAVTVEVAGAGCIEVVCDAGEAPAPPRVRALDGGRVIAGSAYRIGFAPRGEAWLNELRLGESGESANLLDRSKARLRLELPLGLVVQRDEDDVWTQVTGEHTGPLRIVREISVRGRVALNVYSRPVRDRFVFYADGFSIPTSVVISSSAALVLRSITLRLSMDLRPNGQLEFRSAPEVPNALPVTGQEGRRGGWAPLDWYLLRSQDTGLVGWLETDPVYASSVTLYYNDDVAHPDPPENVPGEFGDHGFLFVSDGDLVAGGFRVVTQAWVVRGRELEEPETVRRRFSVRPSYQIR